MISRYLFFTFRNYITSCSSSLLRGFSGLFRSRQKIYSGSFIFSALEHSANNFAVSFDQLKLLPKRAFTFWSCHVSDKQQYTKLLLYKRFICYGNSALVGYITLYLHMKVIFLAEFSNFSHHR